MGGKSLLCLALVLGASLVFLGGCPFFIEDGPWPPASVEVTPNPAQVTVGGTVQLTAVAKDEWGESYTTLPADFNWQIVSGASFASVDSSGLVTGLAEGTATVQATLSRVSGRAQVTVSAPPVPALEWPGQNLAPG